MQTVKSALLAGCPKGQSATKSTPCGVGEIASTAVGGFHFTERVSVRFHLRAAPEDFTFCRQAKDFTLLTFGTQTSCLQRYATKNRLE